MAVDGVGDQVPMADEKDPALALEGINVLEDTIVRCNNCYNVFTDSVFYLDKKLMGVTECNLEPDELYLTGKFLILIILNTV